MNDTKQRVRIEPNPKWVRGVIAGQLVVDSKRAQFVWEVPYYPAWYFPVDDVRATLTESGDTFRSPSRGEGTRYDVAIGDNVVANAAWRHLDSPVEALRDLVRFEWTAVESWFEEDREVFVHPRSPEVRVDALPSSRHVRVIIDGEVVADSTRSTVLYETNLPPRYYLPKSDVRMDFLTPTELSTACPYKGWANYWTVNVNGSDHADVAWGYRTPLPESGAIAGLVCFYNEKIELELDGELVIQPRTKFS